VVGDVLLKGLKKLQTRFPFIGDVRGKGLLTAFELVSDLETMEPLPAEAAAHSRLVDIAYELGLIIYSRRSRDGLKGDHFLVCPPMITTAEQINDILSILDDSLKILANEMNLPIGAGK
ncbi:MAG: aminotransferase class III-fold pyridoxal phosphate-dependent enzyme, partial [Kordiimonadaceae bacterium]|nr:aminotransferase class III-fold pyridoxal phosphate-dependent enzyme [Kordiimonadaceae bacterium]